MSIERAIVIVILTVLAVAVIILTFRELGGL